MLVRTLLLRRAFVDSVKVLLSSGSGGDGASVMSHEHGNEFAGPGGGNGGRGGHVMLRCSKHVHDLGHIKEMGSQLSAGPGSSGYARQAHGRKGRDLWLELPVGTELIDVDTNEVVYDLDESGMEVLLLEGGQGGKGNAAFANKWHHSPVESTKGLPGNAVLAQVELKTIADCGLIGFPNAGKSSLLAAVSTSRPAIAPYAFTTLRPYVGVVHDLYGNTCRIADIPGLIDGAYENRGLGHQFLRHVERTKSLALVVDMCDTYRPGGGTVGGGAIVEPWDAVAVLKQELEYYLPGLSSKVLMVFANKMDLDRDAAGMPLHLKLEELRRRVEVPVFPISAAVGVALGPQASQSGLPSAMQYLCGEVFQQKKSERDIRQLRVSTERDQLERVFRATNNGLFTPGLSEADPSLSLVDQQLDFLGQSGLGDDFDGYEHSIAKGELHSYRDLTMKGRSWSVSQPPGST